jgi:hypothetical protein
MADVQVINGGSVIGFKALTDEAAQWMRDNCETENWQWWCGAMYVDVRYAGGLAIAIEDAGFSYAPL